MKGYIDSTAGEIVAGDSLLDPMTGVLCRVTSVEPVSDTGIVAIHMTGSVSGSYMGLTVKPDRPLRRAPRNGEGATKAIERRPSAVALCACGAATRIACMTSCLKG